MGKEINLMANYPKTKRDVMSRGLSKSENDRMLASEFGKAFFDGDRSHGYGGYSYHPRFWDNVVSDFQRHYALRSGDRLLDVGCAKGFMIYDMQRKIPGLDVYGIDISAYAIENCLDQVRARCQVANAVELPFDDKSMDIVVSITTIHNLEGIELATALKEIERVARRGSFITVDAYTNDAEKEAMLAWNLTAKTILHVDEWKELFRDVGYTGDYYWFMP